MVKITLLLFLVGSLLTIAVSKSTNSVITKRASTQFDSNCDSSDPEYFYASSVSKCFKLHLKPKNWHDAYTVCRGESARLAMVHSPEEAKILTDYLLRYPEKSLKGDFNKSRVLLDFSDLVHSGEYVTREGKTLEEAGYSAWAPGQPDNAGGKEHCGSMFRDGKLNNITCDKKTLFFCEKQSFH